MRTAYDATIHAYLLTNVTPTHALLDVLTPQSCPMLTKLVLGKCYESYQVNI
jgi:hypothetical protein